MALRPTSECELFEVTEGQHQYALSRTDCLLKVLDRPLRDIVANAYLQGVIDATEFIALQKDDAPK